METYTEEFNIWWEDNQEGKYGSVAIMEMALKSLAFDAWQSAIKSVIKEEF